MGRRNPINMNAKARAKRNFWIQTSVGSLIGLLLIGAYIRSATKPLDAEDLSIDAGDLRSLCAAGVEFANQFEAGNLTETFFTEQLELMHDKVASIRSKVDTPGFEPEIRSDVESAGRAATEIEIAFDYLTLHPRDAEKAKETLKQIVTPLEQLEDKLKQEAQQ